MIIGIAGLGLIGGSMAKAASAFTDHRVLGFDLNEAVLSAALSDGGIRDVLGEENLPDCDLLLLALYPAASVEYVRSHLGRIRPGCLLVDLCGVKQAVMGPMEELLSSPEGSKLRYLGGHPMAGKEKSGYQNADRDLFREASMILVPPEGRREALEQDGTLKLAEEFFLSLGFGRITLTTAQEHDRVIAFTSQLAHVVSSAYVKSPTARQHYGFSAGSYKDLTRVARLNETMWTELFLDNRESLLTEVEGIIQRLGEYRDALSEGNRDTLFRLLREGRECKEGIDSYENS